MSNPLIKAGPCWSSLWGSHCSGLLTLEEHDVCTPRADRIRPIPPGFGWKMCKQNSRVTSKADEKTFSIHTALSHFSREKCLLCCVQKYLCIMSQDLKSTNRKKNHLRELFFSYSLISSSETDEKLSTLQQDFLLIGITSHDNFYLSLLLCEAWH